MTNPIDSYSVYVSHLCKRYGEINALDGLSFSIQKGEILGFLGPNGAGKSTTMKILSGLIPATSGFAYVCGKSVSNNVQEVKNHIGFMPENNPLPDEMRVIEYLRYRARLKGIDRSAVKRRVDEVMELCELHRKASHRIISNLSKGYRQRVGIADAILAKPDLIIMDEPTIGLDPHQILSIRNLINSLRGDMSVIISSHILPEIELVCDRVIIINQGTIVANGTPADLRTEFLPAYRYAVEAKISKENFDTIIKKIDTSLILESCDEIGDSAFNKFIVSSQDNKNLGEDLIYELSKDSTLRLREIYEIKPSLEDIFMAATKRNWENIRDIKQRGGK